MKQNFTQIKRQKKAVVQTNSSHLNAGIKSGEQTKKITYSFFSYCIRNERIRTNFPVSITHTVSQISSI